MRSIGASVLAAVMTALPAEAQEAGKFDACRAAPSHACVLDLMWDAMPRVTTNYVGETKRAFIEAALLSGDKALLDLYVERTGWKSPEALNASYINVARRKKDRDVLVLHGDRAIAGRSYDWYELSNLAHGLAEVGEAGRARQVAERIPHGDDDSVTTLNLYRSVQETIAFHDPAPMTARTWVDRIAGDDSWWDASDIAWFKTAEAKASDPESLMAFAKEIQQRYLTDGWKYLRALVRLAPDMSLAGEPAETLFASYVADWADPRNDNIAELVLAMAVRASPEVRAAILAQVDARQPAPPPRIAVMRKFAGEPDTVLDFWGKAALGLSGGTLEQRQAARAFASLTREEFIAKAREGEDMFALSLPGVLRAAAGMAPDADYAQAIAELMAELGEPRTIDGYDHARYATEWARDNCKAELFGVAHARLARSGEPEDAMWRARFNRNPLSVVRTVTYGDRPINSALASALRGYQEVILKGYCPK